MTKIAIAFGLFLVASCGADTLDNLTFTPRSGCTGVCDTRVNCKSITSSDLNGCQLNCDDGKRGTESCTNEETLWKSVRDNCTKDKMCSQGAAMYDACVAAEKAKCTR